MEIAPHLKHLALMFNPASSPYAQMFFQSIETATPRFAVQAVKLLVGTTPGVEVRIRPAGRRDPHQQRPDVHYALRTVGAVARAAGDHHQERLPAANRPSHPGPAAEPLVLGESAATSPTQSGPRRPPSGGEAARGIGFQNAHCQNAGASHLS